jgi:hypothetical protein
VSTLFFALVPALQATRFELVRAMRGEVVRDARPGRARNALLALQVTASVLLLICSAVFLRSAMAAADVDPGIRTADVVTMEIQNEQMRGAALDVVRREPSVMAVAAAWPGGLGGRTAIAEGAPAVGKSTVTYQFVSPEYFGVLGIDLVRGRGFATTERNASAAVAIVSETVARQLWPGLEPVGQVLRLDVDAASNASTAGNAGNRGTAGHTSTPGNASAANSVGAAGNTGVAGNPGVAGNTGVVGGAGGTGVAGGTRAAMGTNSASSARNANNPGNASNPPREKDDPVLLSRTVVVIGVARDVAGFRLGGMRLAGAGVYVPIAPEAARTSLQIRVRGDADRARRVLAERFDAIDPNLATIGTLRTLATMEAFLLGIPFWLTLVLGALALILTLSGLFSVLSYLVEQRTREIGIRIALGATSRGIGFLVLWQSAGPVALGMLLGGGLTASLGIALLATPAAEQIGSTLRLFDPIAYAISLLSIVIACVCAALIPARRAGRIDPVAALRQD